VIIYVLGCVDVILDSMAGGHLAASEVRLDSTAAGTTGDLDDGVP
jgi:hypothetical protein